MNLRRILRFLFALALTFACLALPASAEEGEEARLWSDFLSGLPDLVRDRLPEEADSERLSEMIGIRSLLSLFAESVGAGVHEALPLLSFLLGCVLLSAAAELLRPDRIGEGSRRAIGAAISASLAVSLWSRAEHGVASLLALLSDMRSVISGAIPAVVGASLAAGCGKSAAVSATALASGIAVTEALTTAALPAIAGCCFGLAIVGSLGSEIRLDGIAKTLRALYMTLLGLVSFILTTSLALQKGLASAADGAAIRGAKYAVSSMIPLVGSSISSILGTLGGSMHLLSRSVGVGAVVALFLLALPPLVYLLLARFSFSISGAVAHLLGAAAAERLLSELRAVYDMLLAVGAICLVMFLISLSLAVSFGMGVAA